MKIIKKIDVWSMAKVQGTIAFAFGFVLGLIQWLSVILVGTAFQGQVNAWIGRQVFSLGAFASLGFIGLVFFAAFIGVMGFIGGAVTGVVYNFLARRGGGLRIEIGPED